MSAWIHMVPDQLAVGHLRTALEAARAPSGTVGNVMRVHSLRPSTMLGHVALYKAVLHDGANTVPEWLQETLGSYVSLLNDCYYSFTNHWANARHLIGDAARADAVETALHARRPEDAFDGLELAMLRYSAKLTLLPGKMEKADVEALRALGADDGQILEVNQVCCYFNYVNRLLNGLGVSLRGDTIGYYVDASGVPLPSGSPR